MGGGELQLAAYGTQNYFFNNNPDVTFFKQVHRTHTNFATESQRLDFHRSDVCIWESTKLTCQVKRHADLLTDLSLVFELPDLFANTTLRSRARWVKRLGEVALQSCVVNIGGTRASRLWGEWLHATAELSMPASKVNLYNRMIANVPEAYDPDMLHSEIDPTRPFVRGRKVIVPLGFWFSKNYGTALPLVALQYHPVEITVEMRAVRDLYQVDVRGEGYTRPDPTDPYHRLSNFTDETVSSSNTLDVSPYIEASYVFLEEAERRKFAESPLEYLMEQVTRIEKLGAANTVMLDLVLQNPVKEIVWLIRDTTAREANTWADLANNEALVSARLLFNGMSRIETKPQEYFSMMQPFRHHAGSPRDGIFVYSFSLEPEQWQPTGACNMSKLNSVRLQLTLAEGRECDVLVFAVNYNFFRVFAGMGGVAFAL